MASTTPFAPTFEFAPQETEGELKASVIQEMPIDGSVQKPIEPAFQNAFLLIIAPLALLVAGAILYLATRGKADTPVDAPKSGGEKGGLWLMGIGGILTALMFVYLMLVQ